MIVGLHHVAVGVSDLDSAVTFYEQAFGFTVVQRSEFDQVDQVDAAIGLTGAKAKMAMLKTPNSYLEVWQYTSPAPRDLRSDPSDHGYPHIALQVTEIEAEYDRLSKLGMTFAGPVVHFGESSSAIYGRDPFGNLIELYEIRDPNTASLTNHDNL